jgi:transcriptional regulator with XRE-family HTH domain
VAPPDVPAEFWAVEQLQQALALRHMGHISRAYRLHPFHAPVFGPRGITQAALAEWLGLTQPQVCRVENGPPIRDLDRLAHWARTLRIPSEHLWFELPRRPSSHLANDPSRRDVDSPVHVSQHQWRTVRRYLNAHRAELTRAAVGLYPPALRLHDTPLLARPEWIPRQPVRLEDIELAWVDDPPPVAVDGSEPEVHGLLPLRTSLRRYDRYTSAIRYVDAPALFENRPSYRLLELCWTDDGRGRMAFGSSTYFEKLDLSEAVGHEFAAVRMREEHRGGSAGTPSARQHWGQLPFRRLIGDPCDLGARSVIPGICTLILRRRANGDASFLLHWRDPAKVATAGGLWDVMPAGEFQPAGIGPCDRTDDFDLWRNIVRELSEELLGTPEHDGSHSGPLTYERWPLYRTLQSARCQGRLHVSCLGVGCGALTLATTIPTVLVIDEDVFDEVFGEIVPANDEGVAITALPGDRSAAGIPFTEDNIRRLLQREPLSASGAACLALAWRHRDTLLA